MSYGAVIKKIRQEKNMSLRQFGELVGLGHSTIDRMEREYSNKGKEKLQVYIDTLKQICDRSGYCFRKFLEEAGYIEPIK
ncbi:MAG: helix-turn-helix domain-containing protein [Firmicutes bacterium]|nr:helix-turn-helix domain-containing protein [Bacillota bacterium]